MFCIKALGLKVSSSAMCYKDLALACTAVVKACCTVVLTILLSTKNFLAGSSVFTVEMSTEFHIAAVHKRISVLQVLLAQDFEGSIQEQSQQARALWGSRPWDLADKCSKLQPEHLTPELQQAQEWCKRYVQQLHSQMDTLQIKEALPETNLQLFTGEAAVTLSVTLVHCIERFRSCMRV